MTVTIFNLVPLYYYDEFLSSELTQAVYRATICLLEKNDRIIARGVALCSPKDNFVKKTGRNKALGMAIMAFEDGSSLKRSKSKENEEWTLFDAEVPAGIRPFYKAEGLADSRSVFLPKLTERENLILKRLLEGRKKLAEQFKGSVSEIKHRDKPFSPEEVRAEFEKSKHSGRNDGG